MHNAATPIRKRKIMDIHEYFLQLAELKAKSDHREGKKDNVFGPDEEEEMHDAYEKAWNELEQSDGH